MSLVKKALLLLFIFTFFTCQEGDVNPDLPMVYTGEVTNIDANGASFQGAVVNGLELQVIDCGFVWDTVVTADFESSRVHLGPLVDEKTFSFQANSDLLEAKEYYVKAFIAYEDVIVIGNWSKFNSEGCKAPVIRSFYPGEGTRGSVIHIAGDHFSLHKNNVKVFFGEYQATVIETSDTLISAVLPNSITVSGNAEITLEIGGQSTRAEDLFYFSGPNISDFNPKIGTCETEITVSGSGFNLGAYTTVYFVELEDHDLYFLPHPRILQKTDSEIVIQLDAKYIASMSTDKIKIVVESAGIVDVSKDAFELQFPSISSVYPSECQKGDIITLEGIHFGETPESNNLTLGPYKVEVIEAGPDQLKVEIPDHFPTGNYYFILQASCAKIAYHHAITILP